jgi:hypothetical protein
MTTCGLRELLFAKERCVQSAAPNVALLNSVRRVILFIDSPRLQHCNHHFHEFTLICPLHELATFQAIVVELLLSELNYFPEVSLVNECVLQHKLDFRNCPAHACAPAHLVVDVRSAMRSPSCARADHA